MQIGDRSLIVNFYDPIALIHLWFCSVSALALIYYLLGGISKRLCSGTSLYMGVLQTVICCISLISLYKWKSQRSVFSARYRSCTLALKYLLHFWYTNLPSNSVHLSLSLFVRAISFWYENLTFWISSVYTSEEDCQKHSKCCDIG